MERCQARREPYNGSRYADLQKRAWKSSTATRTGSLLITMFSVIPLYQNRKIKNSLCLRTQALQHRFQDRRCHSLILHSNLD